MTPSPRLAASALALALVATAALAKVETWRHDSPSAFAKGKKDGVVVSDAGRVRLGRKVAAVGTLDATHVWDVARDANGAIYAATGSAGKVFRREGDGPWIIVHDAEDTQALSLVALPDGRVFAGTGPSGNVVEVSDPKAPSSRPDPGVQYVWDLAADKLGNLYAATGPTGQLWRRDPAGKWSLLLDSKHPHLLCVALGPDGSAYAGSDGEGLIYRVAPDGRVSVLYDAPQNEVRALHMGDDGTLYAGTAAEAGGGPPRAPAGNDAGGSAATPGGTVTPRPGPPGENAVYRIGPDGAPREIFRARAMIYALTSRGDKIFAGTGPEGLVYELRDDGREASPIARIDHGQALALARGDRGELLVGAGDPGGVLAVAPGFVPRGTLTSDVLDAKLTSRFGAIAWKGEAPPGTAISVQLRTGNVGEPDASWSDWSTPTNDAGGEESVIPRGRFAQYRAMLKSDDRAHTPDLRSVAILYQTANYAPEIARVVVPDVTAGDGAAKAPRITVRWDATDPNDDDLAYTLRIRKDGWPDWVTITETPLAEKTYNWDAASVPGGVYRIQVVATDRPSNPPASAMVRELTSESFVVDHLAPTVALSMSKGGVSAAIKDDLTRVVKAAYSLDGGEWVAIFPDDGLFDATSESIAIPLEGLKPGTHILTVRATDAAGNVGAGDAILKSP